jgi:hypothetical protein
MDVIVVGVDLSTGAKAALRFALEEERLRRATLRAVYAWQFGYFGGSGIEGSLPAVGGTLDEFRTAAEAALDAMLRAAILETGNVDIERSAVQGRPATSHRGISSRRSARGRLAWPRRFCGTATRICEPAVRSSRELSRSDRPNPTGAIRVEAIDGAAQVHPTNRCCARPTRQRSGHVNGQTDRVVSRKATDYGERAVCMSVCQQFCPTYFLRKRPPTPTRHAFVRKSLARESVS